jgi:hypothetical protein
LSKSIYSNNKPVGEGLLDVNLRPNQTDAVADKRATPSFIAINRLFSETAAVNREPD